MQAGALLHIEALLRMLQTTPLKWEYRDLSLYSHLCVAQNGTFVVGSLARNSSFPKWENGTCPYIPT